MSLPWPDLTTAEWQVRLDALPLRRVDLVGLFGAAFVEAEHPRGADGKFAFAEGDAKRLRDAIGEAVTPGSRDKPVWEGPAHLNSTDAERGAVKARIVVALAGPMEAALIRAGAPTGADVVAPRVVQDKLDTWATSSGDHSVYAVRMQQAVEDEFHLTGAATTHFEPDVTREARAYPEEAKALDRAYVRAEYEATQHWFADRGITHVSLYRGIHDDPLAVGVHPVDLQPASSWSTEFHTAASFASEINTHDSGAEARVLTARIPVDRILSTCVTGRGALNESEIIVLGGRLDAEVYDDWNDKGPLRHVVAPVRAPYVPLHPHQLAADPPRVNLDARLSNADWPKRTDDHFFGGATAPRRPYVAKLRALADDPEDPR